MSEYKYCRLEGDGSIARLVIDREQSFNSLSSGVLKEISAITEDLVSEWTESENYPQIFVIQTAGEKAFVAGADIFEMSSLGESEVQAFTACGHQTMSRLESLPVPTFALCDGIALGGGLELALSCDFIIASSSASFGLPEVTLGLIPGFGGTVRLQERIGPAKAKRLILSGERVSAEQALKLGLVDFVVEDKGFAEGSNEILSEFLKPSAMAQRSAKSACNSAQTSETRERALAREQTLFLSSITSADGKEGVTAFTEKRKPSFRK